MTWSAPDNGTSEPGRTGDDLSTRGGEPRPASQPSPSPPIPPASPGTEPGLYPSDGSAGEPPPGAVPASGSPSGAVPSGSPSGVVPAGGFPPGGPASEYQSGGGPVGGFPQAYPSPPVAAGQTNTMAIVSLICALGGFVTLISAPVGAILGHVARRQIRQSGEQGDGMALAAIIVGWTLTGLAALACCGGLIFAIAAASTSTVR